MEWNIRKRCMDTLLTRPIYRYNYIVYSEVDSMLPIMGMQIPLAVIQLCWWTLEHIFNRLCLCFVGMISSLVYESCWVFWVWISWLTDSVLTCLYGLYLTLSSLNILASTECQVLHFSEWAVLWCWRCFSVDGVTALVLWSVGVTIPIQWLFTVHCEGVYSLRV